jgi:predicted house-cleaning noncanonical NTP pyrophosphatase (MazG superfamily)
MEQKQYNKLVRDNIPDILETKGLAFDFHVAEDAEYEEKLFAKLVEEAREVEEAKSIEEIADLYEVLEAIRKLKGYSEEEIRKVQKEKGERRGKFEKKIILEHSDPNYP